MNVLISINTSWNIYNFRLDLIKDIQRKGYSVFALAPRDEYTPKLEKQGVQCFHIDINAKGTNPIRDSILIYKYYKLLKKIKPDIILSYTIKPNIYGNFAANLLDIPTINNISGLGTLFIKNSIYTYFGKILYKVSLSSSSHVFFQNTSDQKLFQDMNLVSAKKNSVIPGSGVDTVHFKINKKKNLGNRFLFVGRLIGDKGIEEYLQAASKVVKIYPKKEFLIAGELGSSNRTAFSKEKLDYYIKSFTQIKFLGKVENIKSILSEVDVMVLPSYREGLSRSILEASSMNLPVITTDTPGCRDVIFDRYNGYLCKERSVVSLFNAIVKMITISEKERILMGKNGRNNVENNFSYKIVNKSYLEKINEIIKKVVPVVIFIINFVK